MTAGAGLIKRSVSIGGHRTSISLEAPFHAELAEIARSRRVSVSALIAEIDAARDPSANLSSALRVFVLNELRQSRNGG